MTRSYVYDAQQTMVVLQCGECGVFFGVPQFFDGERRQDGGSFYCINGHCRSYREPEVIRLRKELEARTRAFVLKGQQLEQEQAATREAREAHQRAERRLVAQKGVVTRLKNKIAAGCCPCCDQQFTDLESHMKESHPDYEQQTEPEGDETPPAAEGQA